jgi:hypothetical protein
MLESRSEMGQRRALVSTRNSKMRDVIIPPERAAICTPRPMTCVTARSEQNYPKSKYSFVFEYKIG